MAFSSGNDSGGPMAEINVTPLVDVMLVLLIIFMITTPLMNHKVKVQLPEAVLDKKPDEKAGLKTPPVTIAVTERGELFWNDERVSVSQLEAKLTIVVQKTPQPMVNIRADGNTKYGIISDAVNTVRRAGMRKVGFVSSPERAGR